MKFEGTLRAHQSSISALQYVDLPQKSLFSGDESGWVIWWSLATRRSIGIWRAHKEKVITIREMNGFLVTHSRDCTIKCWNLDTSLSTQLPLSSQSDYPCPSLEWEMPVNALNFCNIDLFEDRLLCPASVDSNNIDVYSLGPPLSRVTGNMSSGKDFGIVMAVKWIDQQRYIVGYESGHVVAYSESKVIDIYDTLCPDPVTAIEVFPSGFVACCASDSVLVVKDAAVSTLKLTKRGVSSVAFKNKTMALTSWDGSVRVYELSDLRLQLLTDISLPTPLVGTESVLKASCVCFSPKNKHGSTLRGRDELVRRRDYMAVGYNNGRISLFFDGKEDEKVNYA